MPVVLKSAVQRKKLLLRPRSGRKQTCPLKICQISQLLCFSSSQTFLRRRSNSYASRFLRRSSSSSSSPPNISVGTWLLLWGQLKALWA